MSRLVWVALGLFAVGLIPSPAPACSLCGSLASRPTLPVLLATGYSQAVERLGDEFPILRKPYKLPELNRAVSALLALPADPGDGKLVALEAARRARASRTRDRS